jgi:hypothetical protein
MPIREPHALRCETIHVWRGDLFAAVETGVGVALIVGHDDDQVRGPALGGAK